MTRRIRSVWLVDSRRYGHEYDKRKRTFYDDKPAAEKQRDKLNRDSAMPDWEVRKFTEEVA